MNTINKMNEQSAGKKTVLLGGMVALATGVLTFFGIKYFQKNKQDAPSSTTPVPEVKDVKPTQTAPPKTTVKPKTEKPKTKPKVKPKVKTVTATKPKAEPPKPINAAAIATGLYTAVLTKAFQAAINLLKPIRSSADYSAVSKAFGAYTVKGKKRTLLEAMFITFTDSAQKQSLRAAFIAMGLKFNDKTKRWTLAGVEKQNQIITTTATKVWKDPKTSVPVPVNMVLGKEVTKRGQFTLFENEKQLFLVQSDHVKHHTN